MAKAEVVENLGGGFYRIRPLKKLKGIPERLQELQAKEANLQAELSRTGAPQVRADLINTQTMIANLQKAAADRVLFCISSDENQNIPEGAEVPVLEHGRSGNAGNYTIAPGDYVFDSKQHSEIVTTQELKKWEWLYARIAQPLAITHRPKFWFGRILSIAGDQLTADVSIFPRDVESKKLLPKATREHLCDCVYRQGNDFARFKVGDIVVVDFHFGAGTPTVIGFAVNPENPVFEPVIPKSEGFELELFLGDTSNSNTDNRWYGLVRGGKTYHWEHTPDDQIRAELHHIQRLGTNYPIEFHLDLHGAFLDDSERNFVQPAVIPFGLDPDNFASWTIPGTGMPYEMGVHTSMPYVTHNLRMVERYSQLTRDVDPSVEHDGRMDFEFDDPLQTVDSRAKDAVVSYDELQPHEFPLYVESLGRPISFPTCIVLDEQGNPSHMRFYDPETFQLIMNRPLQLEYQDNGSPRYTAGCNPFSCVHGKRPIFSGSNEEILRWGMQEHFYVPNDYKDPGIYYPPIQSYRSRPGQNNDNPISLDGRVNADKLWRYEYPETRVGESYAYNFLPSDLKAINPLVEDTGSEQYPILTVPVDLPYYDTWGGPYIPDFALRNLYPGKIFGTDSGILTVRNEVTGALTDRVDIPQMGTFLDRVADYSRTLYDENNQPYPEEPNYLTFSENKISFRHMVNGTLHKRAAK